MSVLNLDKLFTPRSVALIGASTQPGSLGNVVMKNLLAARFPGPVMPVHPKYTSVESVIAYPSVAALPEVPDLALICTPPITVPALIAELGERGTRAAVVLTAGFSAQAGGVSHADLLKAAKPHGLRILGPNCVGLLIPGIGLNASFAHAAALPGKLALISQSGALCTVILDWACSRGIGFSHFISLGDSADLDFADCLDYLANDTDTQGLLLYIESIRRARKFMSAARAAARNKTVLCIKAGRVAEGARAAASHTGALAGSDEVFEAAIRRAGMLRVYEIDEMFTAVETLARARHVRGDRIAILTNGGGPGVLATDNLVKSGAHLAELSPATITQLDACLPRTWSRGNPVDIIGDADSRRYGEALRCLLADPGIDAVVCLHVPTAISSSTECARAVAEVAKDGKLPVLTSWMGDRHVAEARQVFQRAGIPSYETPEMVIRALVHILRYQHNQEQLMETPPSLAVEFEPDVAAARAVIATALEVGRDTLTEPEAKAVLAAYAIPVVETRVVQDGSGAAVVTAELGGPVALKLLSPDISHKSDVGGVALDLCGEEAVLSAAQAMLARVGKARPKARVEGFTVQRMARRPGAHELIVGAATDPIFGPVILFGQGGTAVEVVADKAITLPPLNLNLARDLIGRTRVYRLLQGYRDRPSANLHAIELCLIKVSQLLIDLPEVAELDINPLLADAQGVLALDARLRIAAPVGAGADRLAIRPYPKELEEKAVLKGQREVVLRPIRPEDEPGHLAFIDQLEPEDLYFRFFTAATRFDHLRVARLTQIDYDREMAFIATAPAGRDRPETLGVVRAVADADKAEAEFAIVVRSDLKHQGLGGLLMRKMVRYCRNRGIRCLAGETLAQNSAMLGLAKRTGFEIEARLDGTVGLRLTLSDQQ